MSIVETLKTLNVYTAESSLKCFSMLALFISSRLDELITVLFLSSFLSCRHLIS